MVNNDTTIEEAIRYFRDARDEIAVEMNELEPCEDRIEKIRDYVEDTISSVTTSMARGMIVSPIETFALCLEIGKTFVALNEASEKL